MIYLLIFLRGSFSSFWFFLQEVLTKPLKYIYIYIVYLSIPKCKGWRKPMKRCSLSFFFNVGLLFWGFLEWKAEYCSASCMEYQHCQGAFQWCRPPLLRGRRWLCTNTPSLLISSNISQIYTCAMRSWGFALIPVLRSLRWVWVWWRSELKL